MAPKRSHNFLAPSNSQRGHIVDDYSGNICEKQGDVYRHPMRCSYSLLLLFLLLGCIRSGSDSTAPELPLYSGVWLGDVTPSGGAPFGARFYIGELDTGLTIRLESQYINQAFTNIETSHDTIRFTWPMDTPRNCLLELRSDHSWEGTCQGDGTGTIDLLLVPPSNGDTPTGLARAAVESEISWMEEQVGRLRILVQAGGNAAAHAPALYESAVSAFENAFELLEETPPSVTIWILYVDSHAEMRQLAGWPAGGWADGVARSAANSVTKDGRSPDHHEVMHVAATVAWGIPASPWEWVNEGLATYAPGECAGVGIHYLASSLIDNGSAEPLNKLMHEFRQLNEANAYLQSASVVGFIHEVFGIEALRSIWKNGPDVLPDVTGMDLDALENSWREFVSKVPTASKALKTVNDQGCL